jgi:hypothetical protein
MQNLKKFIASGAVEIAKCCGSVGLYTAKCKNLSIMMLLRLQQGKR